MSAQPIPVVRFRAFDSNGAPLAGGKLYSYAAGTSTPLATYTTRAGDVANTNPVVLDAAGEADVWLTSGTLYKFELRDASDVLQWSKDNVLTLEEPGELATFAQGITVTNSNANAPGATITGNGTAPGVSVTGGATGTGGIFVGGATSGGGVKATATGTGTGVAGFGAGVTGSGPDGVGGLFVGAGGAADASAAGNSGVYAKGFSSGDGVVARGGDEGRGAVLYGGTPSTTNANGRTGLEVLGGDGNGTGVGGTGLDVSAGLPGSTATVRVEAINVSNGDIRMSVTAPASTTAMRNRLTTTNIPKAWARVVNVGSNSTSVTISAGFNIASAVVDSAAGDMVITLAEPMASGSYAVLLSTWSANGFTVSQNGVITASTFRIAAWNTLTNATHNLYSGTPIGVSILVFGEQ